MLPRPPNSGLIGRVPSLSRIARSFALIGCSLLLPATATSQTTQTSVELDVPSYESELDRIAESIKHPEQIPELRKSLPRAWPVQVGDKSMQVATDWLASDLKKIEEDPAKYASVSREVTSRLGAMRKAAEGLEQGKESVNLDAAHTQLDKILSGREFGAAQGPSQLDILKARIARWLSQQIYKILQRLHLGAKAGNALAWIIVGLAFSRALLLGLEDSFASGSQARNQRGSCHGIGRSARVGQRRARGCRSRRLSRGGALRVLGRGRTPRNAGCAEARSRAHSARIVALAGSSPE